ncbi:MAG: putative Ig domain-containing protein [Myxococcota bacterium]
MIRPMTRTLGVLASLGLCTACGGGDDSATTGASMDAATQPVEQATTNATNSAPAITRVELSPSSPQPGERLTVEIQASDPENQQLRYEYEWFVNEVRAASTESSYHIEGNVGKGQTIRVSVMAYDGIDRSPAVTDSVRIGNSAPTLHALRLDPEERVSAGSDVTARPQATDQDDDPLEYTYRWDVNGETVWTESDVLSSELFERGDSIVVTVTASDGNDESNEIRSAPIPVVNSNPVITSTPGAFDDEGRFIYPLEVSDPDGDQKFRYRLAKGPLGMEIDIVDGTVRWTPTESQAGKHPVRIEVSDANGGMATQSFLVTLNFEDLDELANTPPASNE